LERAKIKPTKVLSQRKYCASKREAIEEQRQTDMGVVLQQTNETKSTFFNLKNSITKLIDK
jgi:hypothetical protein